MRIVSMAYTTPAVIARKKTVTRRSWKPGYAEHFQKGDFLEAWSRSPRNGGKPVALIRLVDDVRLEPIATPGLSEVDRGREVSRLWHEEGFAYLDEPGDPANYVLLEAARTWYASEKSYYTLRFEVLQVIDDSLDTLEERARCRDAIIRFISQEVQE